MNLVFWGDNEDGLSSLESVYGDRVILLDVNNVGHAKLYIDLNADRFCVSSMSREWKKQERAEKKSLFN